MTNGQRYTAASAILLAVALLVFGMPASRTVIRRSAPLVATEQTPSAAAMPATAAVVRGPVAVDVPISIPVPAATAANPPASGGPALAAVGSAAGVVPGIVAIVRPAASTDASGRDDASIAGYFLTRAGFAYTTVVLAGSLATWWRARWLAPHTTRQ